MDPKPYLDYLDKEMTIMGILSVFSVAAPAGILVTTIGKDSTIATQFWSSAEVFILAGSIFCVFAAGFFYKERSLLAIYYGLISFAQTAVDGSEQSREDIKYWLNEANSFATWWPYCCAFTLLFAGFAYYLAGVFLFVMPSHPNLVSSSNLHSLKLILFWLIPALATFICISETYARIVHDTSIWTEYSRLVRKRKPRSPRTA